MTHQGAERDMFQDTITEQEFLITELRYSPVQIRAQLDHLSPEERKACGEILSTLQTGEAGFSERCARALRRSYAGSVEGDTFETLRARTLEMLEAHEGLWAPAMLAMVRDRVRDDRARATEIANLRHVHLTD